MPVSCETIWVEALKNIEGKVSPATYSLWFRNTRLLSAKDGYCTIGVPNSYTAVWLQRHFMSVVGEILRSSLKKDVNVEFSVIKGRPASHTEDAVRKGGKRKPAQAVKRSAVAGKANQRVLRLEDFVVGPSNQLAYMSAMEMLQSPSRPFDTLFIYGSVGLGKTHLLQGIQNHVNSNGCSNKAIYMPAEHWTNEFISALKTGRLEDFRNKYRRADVLLMDDVHFLSNKSGIQEEFLHTFNTLYHSAKRIIFASDAHPKLIKKIKESLASRMMSGMIAEIRPPDYETSREILRAKAEAAGNELPSEVLGYMAERLKEKSVREFESMLTAVTAVSAAYKRKINISLVREVLSGLSNNRLKKVRIEDIERCVSEHFKLSPEDLRSSRKKRSQVLPIHLCCYLARTLTRASYQEIGDYFGNRRHTTCIAAIKKIESRIKKDSEFCDLVERLSDAARSGRT